ncbi:hypothetical protein SAMN04487770_13642 [Butyrivibrio sp. ob235]|uniref:hypothetical protein n=1 Tax=Butyrivibrio sp. ob235 TaxID=1761780 RepID=UPI0008BFF189|nr:hypothetical protein [Butyrivibrio sp. ob235]SEM39131.1 hypothetical protein SAMN04487770_13642 [Butyrivibrio sp. ob235]
MDGTAFVGKLKNGAPIDPNENVFNTILGEYERVLMESLVTSFGLDFLVHDQHGGDVDTINNVRKIDDDPLMKYKNANNAVNYDERGEYDRHEYHEKNLFYKEHTANAKREFNENGIWMEDGYVSGNKVAYNKALPDQNRAEYDHIVSAKNIHDDRGRVLAELNGSDLANNEDNLIFTNMKLNNNMRDKSVEEYIQWCEEHPEQVNYNGKKGEPLPEDVKKKLRSEYKRAHDAYEAKVARAYYTSPKFAKDTAVSAGKRGAEMALRQALGFVFIEIWLAARDEIKKTAPGSSLEEIIYSIERGIRKGVENAKAKYKEVISKIEEGFAAGALASLTTTLCNIFFTTAKNIVKSIRQIYASIVQAGKVLLFNPENLMLGDRVKKTTIILATGASVLIGSAVGEIISKTPIGMTPVIGNIVSVFSSSLVSGLLSCSFLIFLDRSEFINSIISRLNSIPSEANNYKEIADAMEALAAKIANIDIASFKKETEKYTKISDDIVKCENEDELNNVLMNAFNSMGIKIPWEGSFDSFMADRNNHLVFD